MGFPITPASHHRLPGIYNIHPLKSQRPHLCTIILINKTKQTLIAIWLQQLGFRVWQCMLWRPPAVSPNNAVVVFFVAIVLWPRSGRGSRPASACALVTIAQKSTVSLCIIFRFFAGFHGRFVPPWSVQYNPTGWYDFLHLCCLLSRLLSPTLFYYSYTYDTRIKNWITMSKLLYINIALLSEFLLIHTMVLQRIWCISMTFWDKCVDDYIGNSKLNDCRNKSRPIVVSGKLYK